eukprot:418697-Amphidinium_carterae.4
MVWQRCWTLSSDFLEFGVLLVHMGTVAIELLVPLFGLRLTLLHSPSESPFSLMQGLQSVLVLSHLEGASNVSTCYQVDNNTATETYATAHFAHFNSTL